MTDLLYYTPKKIIKNSLPLDTSGRFIPSKLPHRNEQILHLRDETLPAMMSRAFSPVHIYGKPGTGKTAVIKHIMPKLEEESKGKVKLFYISFRERKINTQYKFYKELLLDEEVKVPKRGLPLLDLYRKFEEYLNSLSEKILVFVLDEIDLIPTRELDEILFTLSRKTKVKKEISIITLSNSIQFFSQLEPRTRSSFNPKMFFFTPYNAVELKDILKYLSSMALEVSQIESGVIPKIAAIAASEGGDCRFAIDILKMVSEKAEKEKTKIKEKYIDIAREFIEKQNIKKEVISLPIHHKYVLEALLSFEKHPVKIGDVYKKYKSLAFSPVGFRRMKDFVSDLDKMDLISTNKKYGGKGGTTTFLEINGAEKNIIKECLVK